MRGMKTVIKNALMKSYLAPSVTAARNRVASNLGSGRLTVIAYHQVKEPADDGSSVTPASFRQQMQYLREHYDVVPLKYAVKRLGRGQVRRRFVSITFDDGYLDNATAAAPIMREVGLSATFFLSTDMIDSTKPFPHDVERGRLNQPHMTWDDVRRLAADGFDIGSHTCSHADLGKVSPEQAEIELRGSRERLEAELRQSIRLFAFPYGKRRHMRPDTLAAAQRHYDVCCSGYGGHNRLPADQGNVRRIVISSGVSFLAFRALLEGWPMLRLNNPHRASAAIATAPAR